MKKLNKFDYDELSSQIIKYNVLRSYTYPVIRQIFFSHIDDKDDVESYTKSFSNFYEVIIKPALSSIIFENNKIDYNTINKILKKYNNSSDNLCALIKENDKYIVYDFKETIHRYLKDILTEKQFNNLIVTNSFK